MKPNNETDKLSMESESKVKNGGTTVNSRFFDCSQLEKSDKLHDSLTDSITRIHSSSIISNGDCELNGKEQDHVFKVKSKFEIVRSTWKGPAEMPEIDNRIRKVRPRTAGDSSQMSETLNHELIHMNVNSKERDEESTIVDIENDGDVIDGNLEQTEDVKSEKECLKGKLRKSDRLLLKNCLIVNGIEEECCNELKNIAISNGVICQITNVSENTNECENDELNDKASCVEVDLEGRKIYPGGIDPSVEVYHTTQHNISTVGDISCVSKCAIRGGTTSLVDVILPNRGETLTEALGRWREEVGRVGSFCNYLPRLSIIKWDESVRCEVEKLMQEERVNSFRISTFDPIDSMTYLEMIKFFNDNGANLEIHLTDNCSMVKENEKRLLAQKHRGLDAYLKSRPVEIEESEIRKWLNLIHRSRSQIPIILSGISNDASAKIAEENKSSSLVVQLSLGSLAFSGDEISKIYCDEKNAAQFITNPPLRSSKHATTHLMKSRIEKVSSRIMIASNQSLYSTQDKENQLNNHFLATPTGINGIEERIPLLWEMFVKQNKFTDSQMISLTSSNPAKHLNLSKTKGKICEGYDADLVVWNVDNFKKVEEFVDLNDYKKDDEKRVRNVYHGRSVTAVPQFVLVNGKFAIYDYEFMAPSNIGKLINTCKFEKEYMLEIEDKKSTTVNEISGHAINDEVIDEDQSDGIGVCMSRSMKKHCIIRNEKLGLYQRPMSSHGVRNQQDSTFSLSGGTWEDGGYKKTSIKIKESGSNRSESFW